MMKDELHPGIAAARYCDVPFPPYRFVPGRHPHPIADPAGHSYHPPGTPPPNVPLVAPEDWRTSEAYLYGCDLYNHAYWWEAHEAWEGLWQRTDKAGVQGRFLQGLIQVSACHLKLFVRGWDGVARLRRTSEEHLRFALSSIGDETYMGLRVAAFLDDACRYIDTIMHLPEPHRVHDASAYPYVLPAE